MSSSVTGTCHGDGYGGGLAFRGFCSPILDGLCNRHGLRLRELDSPAQQCSFEGALTLSLELRQCRTDISGEPRRSLACFCIVKDIARERVLKLPLIRRGQGG